MRHDRATACRRAPRADRARARRSRGSGHRARVWSRSATPTARSSTGTSRGRLRPQRGTPNAARASPRDADPAEQTGRLQQKYERDDREDDGKRDVLKEDFAEGVRRSDEHASRDRAGEGSQAADDHDDERVEEAGIGVHARLHAEHRRGDDSGKAGERGTGREGRCEEPIRVHAERPEHFSVLDAGADEHADARPAVDHRHRGGERDAEMRSEEHTSELQSPCNLVCRLLLEKKNTQTRAQLLATSALLPATKSYKHLLPHSTSLSHPPRSSISATYPHASTNDSGHSVTSSTA